MATITSITTTTHGQEVTPAVHRAAINGSYPLYLKGDEICIDAASSTDGLLPDLVGGDVAEKIWNFFIGKGLSAEQTAGIMGNLEWESRLNPGIEELVPNIYGTRGYGIAQWTGGRRDALEAAAAAQGVPVNDLALQLQLLYTELIARTPRPGSGYSGANEWDVIKSITGSVSSEVIREVTIFFHYSFERSSQSEASVIAKRVPLSQKWYDVFGSVTGAFTTTPNGAGGCRNIGPTAVAGSIVETIKLLAWPYSTKGMNQNTDATEAYQLAAAKYLKNIDAQVLTDCTYFVMTVMRESGVDPEFPSGTNIINQYLRTNNGTKYTVIENPTRADLQPGDILQHTDGGCSPSGCWSGHILIYTGDLDGSGSYVAADASKYTRVPGYLTEASISAMLSSPTVILARKI